MILPNATSRPFSNRLVFALVLLLTLATSSCNKNDGGGSAGASSGNGVDAIAGSGGDRDAVKAVSDELAKRWTKTSDGWISEFPSKVSLLTGQRSGPESYYRQIKALKFDLETNDLSESDKLNGVQFRGHCQFDPAPVRLYNDPNAFGGPTWSEWHPSNESAVVVKKNGKWDVVGEAGGWIVAGAAPAPGVVAQLK